MKVGNEMIEMNEMMKTQDTLRAKTRTELQVGQDEVRDVRLIREILPKTGRFEL
ncbi:MULTISPECIES: hypothetical protein [unclassified Paenibacillus]|jgi:hypothetical protein|uniref:hypothetical protein n=1 Tax=unclassified Paenibacillus TaxID=185978 RepID=UPI0030EF28EE